MFTGNPYCHTRLSIQLSVVPELFEFLIHDHVSHYVFKFALPPFSVLAFWKFFLVYCPLVLCSVSTLQVKVFLVLYALQLLIFVGTLAFGNKRIILILFHNDAS